MTSSFYVTQLFAVMTLMSTCCLAADIDYVNASLEFSKLKQEQILILSEIEKLKELLLTSTSDPSYESGPEYQSDSSSDEVTRRLSNIESEVRKLSKAMRRLTRRLLATQAGQCCPDVKVSLSPRASRHLHDISGSYEKLDWGEAYVHNSTGYYLFWYDYGYPGNWPWDRWMIGSTPGEYRGNFLRNWKHSHVCPERVSGTWQYYHNSKWYSDTAIKIECQPLFDD